MRPERWRARLRTARAMAWLVRARLTVAIVPFERWRNSLGCAGEPECADLAAARQLAADVEWAAGRVPFPTKCLPRAMALSWTLRRRGIAHVVAFAVRPPELRGADNDLHAWVEVGTAKVLGDLPGPWLETLRLSGAALRN